MVGVVGDPSCHSMEGQNSKARRWISGSFGAASGVPLSHLVVFEGEGVPEEFSNFL